MPTRLDPKLLSWASLLEESTREQAVVASRMPFIHPYLALMPDAHLGKGATVGSVIPTVEAIMPAAVGVDIGCGMMALRTQYRRSELPADRARLRQRIERLVPLSAGGYNRRIHDDATQEAVDALARQAASGGFSPDAYAQNWRLQLGTLGSGNHFIEVSLDEDDQVWLFLHSGSRGVGNKIAMHHIRVAQQQCEKARISLPNPDLAYLQEGTAEFDRYLTELQWAQEFARQNRREMMRRVVTAFEEWVGDAVEPELEVNCHHNYTVRERHFGRQVWLSRKGAINAGAGVLGLIPGSMGTLSYVVRGRGNAESLNSAPHGAGRAFSRSAARRTFTQEDLRRAMGDIEYRDTAQFIDEIPAAYKDIDVVMADAADLVEVVHTLRQIVNVKGD